MKKIIDWLKGPASDFALFCLILILANVIGYRAFARIDFTRQGTYSLSQATKNTLQTLSSPLSVKVFFSDDLPSPYSETAQYVKDILVEYKGSANKNFSYQFFKMNKPENQAIARNYGIHQVQIQKVGRTEVGFMQAWMGLAIVYGDSIELLDEITSDSGFEYNLTSKISKIVSTVDALYGLNSDDSISMTLFASEELSQFNISGFDSLDTVVQNAFNSVNKKNLNRLSYIRKYPSDEESVALAEKYGLPVVSYKDKNNKEGNALFGIVLEHGDSFRTVPLAIQRSFFGYGISGLDELEANINDSLQSLLAKSTEIGYVTGHQEASLTDENGSQIHLVSLISDMYTFKELNLAEDEIPANLTSIVINGAKSKFTEEELFKIDQFVMKGGNLIVFQDPFDASQANYYSQPQYTPIETGLERILDSYGVKLEKNYVFDEQCYVQRQRGYGEIKLFWAPQLQKKQLDQKSPITKNLGYVILLQSGSLDVEKAKENKNIKLSVLAKTSENAWAEQSGFQLAPGMQPPFNKAEEKSYNLIALLEGKFSSAFDSNPSENKEDSGELNASKHIKKSAQNGKIFVANTAMITTNMLIDDSGSEPIALFVRNVMDYMNGNEDLCTMRTKSLSINTLSNPKSPLAVIVKYFNMIFIPLLVAIAGFVVYRARILRKKKIRLEYNPNDSRIENSK
mgnify:FL=1